MKRTARISVALAVLVAAVGLLILGWNQTTAQVPARPGTAGQTFGGFEGLLTKGGDKSMNLTVTLRLCGAKADTEQVIGQFNQATDSFLVVKLQNQTDLTF